MCIRELSGFVFFLAVFSGQTIQAAVLSVNAAAPVGAEISHTGTALGNGDIEDEQDYIASDRAAQGQFFTTLTDAGVTGYLLNAVTVLQNDGAADVSGSAVYTLRVTVPGALNTLVVLDTETATATAAGSGTNYLTFTFDTPVELLPGTVYGFDIGLNSGYIPIDGSAVGDTAAYGGGNAYNSADDGVGDLNYGNVNFDRTFFIDTSPVAVPEPSTIALFGLGLLSLTGIVLRRRI